MNNNVTIDRCPCCGAGIQASVVMYVNITGLNRARYEEAHGVGDMPPYIDEWENAWDEPAWDDERLRIYCADDCGWDGVKWLATGEMGVKA